MTTAEMTSRSGEDLSPAQEVKTAVAGFVADFKGFRDEMSNRMKQQEHRMTMLDRKTSAGHRPALATQADQEAPHQKAFNAYLRSGDDDGLRGLQLEGKAMNSSVAADGGYLVDPQTSTAVQGVLRSAASLRQIANVVTVEATSYDVLVDTSDIGSGWVTETGSVAETGTSTMDRISIPLFELAALPKASQRLLDDSAFDIEGWLAERIADKFARSEAAAFVSGDGTDKPTGFLTHPTVADATWAWDSLGYIATGSDGGFDLNDPSDAIVDLVYALGARYRANASFVMNSKTAGAVRKLKDAEGRFLWADSLAAGEPARLMGYPVLLCEDMPDIASGSLSVAFGDFHAGYTIAERPDLRVLRDPFSAKPHVLFYATKRVGGDVTDFAAIKLLKFGAS
ncbi:phage major capsid protein, HK97 family [Pseudooceanicola nitratireducens]|jgi:HK97 family phage major capsid protein|uniref:Phage major capsid protein, HK97 family n=1 Tax=Pseudooceanicola nitratireducens TaxID=517719 RepID=A0A1I1KWN3_9RHOB|nr:phage major capsid protein [Pseudooceanicola nitratireducens]SEJ42537.1 phage major capsid protein, HK97 family [Pseudooceanicola nitratireducens]SFC65045.1 phage major capsid protein, HK97 family [Pseudooceanicola nitratireducens]